MRRKSRRRNRLIGPYCTARTGSSANPPEAQQRNYNRVVAAKQLGIMGGTFDPIHHGHLVTAEEAFWQFGLDEVLFLPAGQPWMKEHPEVSPAEDRYLMTVIAT